MWAQKFTVIQQIQYSNMWITTAIVNHEHTISFDVDSSGWTWKWFIVCNAVLPDHPKWFQLNTPPFPFLNWGSSCYLLIFFRLNMFWPRFYNFCFWAIGIFVIRYWQWLSVTSSLTIILDAWYFENDTQYSYPDSILVTRYSDNDAGHFKTLLPTIPGQSD